MTTWAETQHTYDDAKKAAEMVNKWMSTLGGDELAQTAQKAATAFNLVVQVSKVAGVASAMMGAKNATQTAEATAETSALASTGIGLGRIALAIGAGATAAAITGAITTYRIKADLEAPSGIEAVKQFIGNVRA